MKLHNSLTDCHFQCELLKGGLKKFLLLHTYLLTFSFLPFSFCLQELYLLLTIYRKPKPQTLI